MSFIRILAVALMLFGCVGLIISQRASITIPPPLLTVTLDGHSVTHELGLVSRGSCTSIAICLKNTADRPITIEHVKTSCPCLSIVLPTLTIGPGDATTADLIVDFSHDPDAAGDLLLRAEGITSQGIRAIDIRVGVTVR